MTSPKVSKKNRIELMIIGAQKAGTTSLKNYLGEHPDIQTHPQKEFGYFSDDTEYNVGLDRAMKKYFKGSKNDKILVAKNAVIYQREKALERLKKYNPDMRIEITLRNPVDRLYSAYLMELNNGSINSSFAEIAELLDDSPKHHQDWRYSLLIGMSRYINHLRTIYNYFPKEQVSVVLFEEFVKDPQQVCKRIYGQLGVDPLFTPDTSIRHNETKMVASFRYARFIKRILRNESRIKKIARNFIPDHSAHGVGEMLRRVNRKEKNHDEMDPEIRKIFINYFKPLNDELSDLLQLDLSSWNK